MFYSLGRVNNACLFPWRLNPSTSRAQACPGLPTFVLSSHPLPGSESAQQQQDHQQSTTIINTIIIIIHHFSASGSQTLYPVLLFPSACCDVTATHAAISPMLPTRRLKLRMKIHVQGHARPDVVPGFILGMIDTKIQPSGHLSPLLCPAQGPLDCSGRRLRGTFQAGIPLCSALLCLIALCLWSTESQAPKG